MRPMRFVLFVAVTVWLAGCAGEPEADGTSVDQSESTPPSDQTAAPSEPGLVEPRRFEVDGTVIWTRSAFDRLSEQATLVRFTSTLIDSGEGLELCLSGVEESEPPQCRGPIVQGLDPTGWTRTLGGVTWGTRTVTVEWPSEGGHLTLVSDEPARSLEPIGDERPTRPSVPLKYSQAELSAAQDMLLSEGLYGPEGPVLSSGSGNLLNRLTIDVAVADRQTIEMITDGFDDPGMLYITGSGEILADT